ncbi:DEAD/DEAH box helicase [Paraferrimonas sp. SM1919]|uniref:DEAD/DEAH box helicase n=1 Tax=Paraferrimonas sp. SM1919 TaxID=2662263 RepID=UPI0013D6870A|nr:DEAD/DEAH box helicase [Paraferrimonas sp. SM1919]
MNFEQLSLTSQVLANLNECGYSELTPIQQQAIPVAIKGQDLMACAATGTGKTAAFSLPIIENILKAPKTNALKALVLTPTRELAIQVGDNISRYSENTGLKVVTVYGGASFNPQRKAVMAGVDILVATPGRLFDLLGQGALTLSQIEYLVIDEADRMLDMGFAPDVEKVKRYLPKQHQSLFFSATFSSEVKKLAAKLLTAPKSIDVTSKSDKPKIEQFGYFLDGRRKAELLAELIGKNNWRQVLVFVSTKEMASRLTKELKLDGIANDVFHGDKTQGARNRALEALKSGAIRALIATDVAARGLDIKSLPIVINFQLPFAAEDYIHRIGRTGRAGQSGQAISLLSETDKPMLTEIEQLLGQKLKLSTPKGYEPGSKLPQRYQGSLSIDESKQEKYKKPFRKRNDNRASSKPNSMQKKRVDNGSKWKKK